MLKILISLPLFIAVAVPAGAYAATPPTCWNGQPAKGKEICITVHIYIIDQQITTCTEGGPWTCPPHIVHPVGVRKPLAFAPVTAGNGPPRRFGHPTRLR